MMSFMCYLSMDINITNIRRLVAELFLISFGYLILYNSEFVAL